MNARSTRILSDLFLVFGAIATLCGLTLHSFGSGDLAMPISVEYANWNPLAIVFLLATLAISGVAAMLYAQKKFRTESRLMACATFGLAVIATSDLNSRLHVVALFFTLFSIAAAPVINILRREITLVTIAFIAANLTSVLVFAMMIFPSDYGLGIAERIWFGVTYLSNAWLLDVLRRDEREE